MRQKRCQKCNGRNHFATVCKKGQARGVHGLSEQPELDGDEHDDSYESSDYEFLAVIVVEPSIHAIEQTSGYAREIYAEMMINNKKIKCRTFRNAFATGPDCPERENQS